MKRAVTKAIQERHVQAFIRTVILTLAGCGIGIATGAAEALFAWGLKEMDALNIQYRPWSYWLMPFAGLLLVWLFQTYGKKAGRGMKLVFQVYQNQEQVLPKRMMFLMGGGTWLSHLAGASVGREGVAMQIGAVISNMAGRWMPGFKKEKNIFLTAGMAAGFAGLFGTPFSAIFLSLEVFTTGRIYFEALAPACAAALFAAKISSLLGLYPESFVIPHVEMHWDQGWKLLLLGAAFGACGALFVWLLHHVKHIFEKWLPSPYIRIFVLSIPLALCMMAASGRYEFGGSALINAACLGQTVYPWDFALKMLLTVFSLSMGFVGGEVMPLFAMGATLGAVLAPLLGMSSLVGAALGYAAVFGSGTNTWLASIMIGLEVFGFEAFPLFFIVSSTAWLISGSLSIYSLQRSIRETFA